MARNHHLAWTVQVGQLHAGLRADLARRLFVQTDDGRHCALRRFAGFLHEASALAHKFQALLETHHVGRRQRRRFTQRKPGRGLKVQSPDLFLQQLECDPAHQINSGLRIFGLRQFRLRSLEANARQIVAHRLVGAIEQRSRRGVGLRQVLAHSDRLGPLPGE